MPKVPCEVRLGTRPMPTEALLVEKA